MMTYLQCLYTYGAHDPRTLAAKRREQREEEDRLRQNSITVESFSPVADFGTLDFGSSSSDWGTTSVQDDRPSFDGFSGGESGGGGGGADW